MMSIECSCIHIDYSDLALLDDIGGEWKANVG